MKKYSIDAVFSMMYRYVWIICGTVFLMEAIFTVYNVMVTIRQSSEDIMEATKHELENKLNVTWKLADAFARDNVLTDTSVSLEERALHLKPYDEVYDLFLIGITDDKGKITSTYDDIPGDIGNRDYFKKVIATGESAITDVFPAGADGSTLNYTICVPYYDKSDTPSGTILMSIPFDGVNQTITKYSPASGFMFTLLSSTNTVMAEQDGSIIGKDFSELIRESSFVSLNADKIISAVESGQSGSYWTIDSGRLLYVNYAQIERTSWKFLTSIDVLSSNKTVFAVLISKILILIMVLFFITYLGKKFAMNKLKAINALVQQVTKLQDNLRQEKFLTTDAFTEFAEISQSGLLDSLSGLPTRRGLEHQLKTIFTTKEDNTRGVLLIIDIDDLKSINDKYGHEAGDMAISAFGKEFKALITDYKGIAGRFGGDEFIAYFPDVKPQFIAQILIDAFRITIDLGTVGVPVHSSIGAAAYPECGTDFQKLYICADKALYKAKAAGKDCYHVYHENEEE